MLRVWINPHLSYSRAKLWQDCPRAFRLGYIEEQPRPAGVAAAFGTAIHWVLEEFLSGSPWILARAYDLLREACRSPGKLDLNIYTEGRPLIESFVARINQAPPTVLALEQEFNLENICRVPITGKIDRVDQIDTNIIRVIDYKTGKYLPDQESLDSDLQLSIYFLAANQLWPGYENIELCLYFLRHDKLLYTKRSLADIARIVTQLRSVSNEIDFAPGGFPAKLNQFCPFCAFRKNCKAYKDELNSGQIPAFL